MGVSKFYNTLCPFLISWSLGVEADDCVFGGHCGDNFVRTFVDVAIGLLPVMVVIAIIVFCCVRCPFCILYKRRRATMGGHVYNRPDSGFLVPSAVPVQPVYPVPSQPPGYTQGGGDTQINFPSTQPSHPASYPGYPQPGYQPSKPGYPAQPGYEPSQTGYQPSQPGYPPPYSGLQPSYPPMSYPPEFSSTGLPNPPGNPPPYPGIGQSSPFNPNC